MNMLRVAGLGGGSATGATFQIGAGALTATFRLRIENATTDPFLLPELKTFSCPAKL